jgi:hypothetical protein
MLVLVLGHRLGIARALEKRNIDYILWSPKRVKNKLNAKDVVVDTYAENFQDFSKKLPAFSLITHTIAGTENAVIPASQIRLWLNLRRNPHSVILKCTDKLLMKNFFSSKEIPLADFLPSDALSAPEVVGKLGLPVVCKVKLSSGGRGVFFLNSIEEVSNKSKNEVYFEKKIEGIEGSIESFIVDQKIVFTSTTSYFKNGACNKIPADFSAQQIELIEQLNQKVLNALEINWGMTHLEYYLTSNGILLGEVALRPPGGYIMETLEHAYQMNFWDKFICVELGLDFGEIPVLKNYTAGTIIHPGVGVVEKIEGISDINKLEGLKKMNFKLSTGDIVKKREGVGEDFGYALFSHENRDQLNSDVDDFYRLLCIEMNEE